MTRLRAWCLASVAAATFMTLDQATKQLAIASVAPGEAEDVFFGIELTNVRNEGVAFGALEGGGVLITLLTTTALLGLVAYFAVKAATPGLWLPIGVILGGAIGNLADRGREGAVIDFIDPVLWPAFNLADAGIVVGILGVFYVVERK